MKNKLCIISYFTSPFPGVGTLRADYWHKHIERLSQGKIDCEMVTATANAELDRKIIVLPMFQSAFDQGLGWIFPLVFFLIKNSHKYDTYLFTGGPFLHFSLIPFIKLILRKKVIVDYRDPFGFNPVFKENKLKVFIKRKLEGVFNFYADQIITVNRYCADLLNVLPGKRIFLIDNGYDESVIPNSPRYPNKPYFILSGSFSIGRNLVEFEKSLISDFSSYYFIHLGNVNLSLKTQKYEYLGYKNYAEALGFIQEADICVLFTSGHPYESTTKIFDYLRFDKKVLIIADEIPTEGGLLEATQDNSNVVWSLNSADEITKAIHKLQKMRAVNIELGTYSRKIGTQALIEILL